MSEQAVKQLMGTNFLTIHVADSMQDIYPQLTEQPERFVVVLDDEDVPLHLATADEMKRKMPRSLEWPSVGDLAARLPEALLIGENVTIDQAMVFFGTMSQLEPQPRGLVVMHDATAVGILPYEALNDYYTKNIVPEAIAEGKVVRKGAPLTVASAVFRCRRHPRCSYHKTVSQVDGSQALLCEIAAAHGRMVLVE